MKKKAMGLLLAAVLMLTMVMPISAATAFTDIEGKDCEEAVTVLSSLGLIEGRSETEYAPEASLTRAEMATILVRIMGAEGAAVSEDIFTDVKSDHWAYSNIAIAYRSGLVIGMGDGVFAPDSNVTHVQLVKMLICALGYDVQAESQGGYPSGYYAKAAQLGMLSGVTAEMNADATRGNMAKILYNTIDLPLFDQATYGEGADGSYIESDDTLLSRYMDIFVEEGTVTANYYTSIKTPERACAADEIAVGSDVYNVGETDAASYLGMRVKIYYSGTMATDSETPEILLIAPGKVAASYEFKSDEITPDTTTAKLVYEVNGAEKTVSIEDDATFIINGKVKDEGVTAADITPELGTVTLVCNNGNSADVVKVWSYTNYTVVSRDTNKKLVYLEGEEEPRTIDPADKTVKSEFITADGASFDVTGVEKWNILSIAESDNVVRIVKSNASVSGKIAEKDDEKVVIDGVEYTVAAEMEVPDVNTTAKFYMDFMGNIADMDTNVASGLKYGYLVGAQYAKGIDGAASFKIFTQEGEMKTFAAASKTILNGDVRSNTEVIDYIPNNATNGNSTIRQLIKYSVNDAGEINELATAADVTGSVDEYAGNAGFNMVLNLNNVGNNQKTTYTTGASGNMYATVTTDTAATHYIHNLRLFGANMVVGGATCIFKIPSENAADDQYKVIPASELLHRTNLPYTTAYDLTESYMLGAICWDVGQAGGSTSDSTAQYWKTMEDPFGLITSISKSLNDDLEPEYNITLVDWGGQIQKIKAKETLVCGTKVANVKTAITNDKFKDPNTGTMMDTGGIYVNKLRAGDIIRFMKDANGYLTVAAIAYRASDPGMLEYSVTAGGGIAGNNESAVYVGGDLVSNGTVKLADANGIVCETELIRDNSKIVENGKGTKVTRVFPTPSKIMLYERDTQTTKAITVNDIVVGDEYVNLWRTITPFIFWVIR